jgi:hypothetical protein
MIFMIFSNGEMGISFGLVDFASNGKVSRGVKMQTV